MRAVCEAWPSIGKARLFSLWLDICNVERCMHGMGFLTSTAPPPTDRLADDVFGGLVVLLSSEQ